MIYDHSTIRSFLIANVLALMVILGSLGTASATESFQSEESKIETTELVELALSGEARLAENRIRVNRFSFRDFGQFQSETLFQDRCTNRAKFDNRLCLPRPPRHNGCGSHLLV